MDGAPTVLDPVAAAGNGRHFPVREGEELEEAYRAIDALEPSRLPGTPTTAQVPVSSALLWWAGALLLSERGLRATRWGKLS
jgi:hypothetical protein